MRSPAWMLVLLLAAGCGAASQSMTRSSVSQANMACTEAARVARGALLRIGYTPQSTTAPQPGAPGVVVATAASGYDRAEQAPARLYTATVTITCSNAGADFDAVTDQPLPGSIGFKGDFARAIEAVAARRVTRPALKERPATGMVITIEPLRSGEAQREVGAALPGVTTVRMRIENRTERTYGFAGERVQMVSQEGARVDPLDAAATAEQIGAAAAAKRIADGLLAPKASLSGFLYFPASAYRRATVVLIDTATEEEEGFRVEF